MITKSQFTEPKIEIKSIWAEPAKDITLDQLIDEMDKLGNKIVKVDRKNNRLGLAIGEQ